MYRPLEMIVFVDHRVFEVLEVLQVGLERAQIGHLLVEKIDLIVLFELLFVIKIYRSLPTKKKNYQTTLTFRARSLWIELKFLMK